MWQSVIGQHRVQEILSKAVISNKVSHAYCFWGNEGVGKDALAIEFAKVLNCSSPFMEGKIIHSCGECKSCVQSKNLQHPNIQLVFALPASKNSSSDDDSPLLKLSDEQIQSIQEQIAIKAEDPYHNISIPQATQIKIASIREVKKMISLSSIQTGRKVVIISEADSMTNEAANAFLKTLEEPNKNVTLIITTSRKDQIPLTILSRCQQVYVEAISETDIQSALVSKNDVDEDSARLLASISRGSYSRAVELLSNDAQFLRNEIVDVLRSALRQTGYRSEILRTLDELLKGMDRNDVEKMLQLLSLWIRDAFIVSQKQDSDTIINRDQIDTLTKFALAFPKRDYLSAIQIVEQVSFSISNNVQVHLAMLTMLIKLRGIFIS